MDLMNDINWKSLIIGAAITAAIIITAIIINVIIIFFISKTPLNFQGQSLPTKPYLLFASILHLHALFFPLNVFYQ